VGAPFLVAVAACLCLAGACGRTGLASPELPHRDAGSPDPPPAPGAIAPSRCGLRQPVDLDGDGVPLVQETVVPLPVGSLLPEGAGGRPMAGTLSAGGGSTLLVTDCLRPGSGASEEGATCGPGVVLVDETGVLGTPIPRRAYGLVFAPPVADVATPPDGTSWLMLPAARPASEADFGFLWSLWSFRCGEATVIVDAASTTSRGRPRLLAVHPTGALLVAPGADDGVEAMSIDPEGNRREIVQTPDRLLSWTVVSGDGAFFRVARPDGREAIRGFGVGGDVAELLLGEETALLPPEVEGGFGERERWLCAARPDGGFAMVRASPEGVRAGTRVRASGELTRGSGCRGLRLARQEGSARPDALFITLPDGGPGEGRRLAAGPLGPEGALVPLGSLGDPYPPSPVLVTEGGAFFVAAEGEGGADRLWFLPRGADAPRPRHRVAVLEDDGGAVVEPLGPWVLLRPSSPPADAELELTLFDPNSGEELDHWRFPVGSLPLLLGDGRLRATIPIPGGPAVRVVGLAPGEAPRTLFDRVDLAAGLRAPAAPGREDLPALVFTRRDGEGRVHALGRRGEAPRSLASGVVDPVPLARGSSGVWLLVGASSPSWAYLPINGAAAGPVVGRELVPAPGTLPEATFAGDGIPWFRFVDGDGRLRIVAGVEAEDGRRPQLLLQASGEVGGASFALTLPVPSDPSSSGEPLAWWLVSADGPDPPPDGTPAPRGSARPEVVCALRPDAGRCWPVPGVPSWLWLPFRQPSTRRVVSPGQVDEAGRIHAVIRPREGADPAAAPGDLLLWRSPSSAL